MDQKEFKVLFTKYINNACSEEELERLLTYFDKSSEYNSDLIKENIEQYFSTEENADHLQEEIEIFQNTEIQLFEQINKNKVRNKTLSLKKVVIAAAACISFAFATISVNKYLSDYFSFQIEKKSDVLALHNDILPGKEQAVLTLGSGEIINLNSLQTGETVETEGVKLIKEKNGQLKYEFVDHKNNNLSHTISTPKGGRYQLTLADGTQVWLNSDSKLTFPASFAANTREVNLVGEGYFEVAKNKQKPFFVHTTHQLIEVTGTRFNVTSYADDRRISTTLVEGQVIINKLGSNTEQIVLKPGQKAILNPNKTGVRVVTANIEEAISWKNGWFVFEDMTLQEILKKASRWYELEIDYTTIPHSRFSGAIPMDVNLSKLIDILEKTSDLSFEVNNKILTVKKKPM